VRLLLPCSDVVPVRSQAAAAPDGAGDGSRAGGEVVLLVEDTPLVRNAVGRMLGDLGYQVIATAGAEEALVILEDDIRIDLLFTDMVLPGGFDGEELSRVARRLRPGMRVLFTSGYTEMRPPAPENGGCSLISKPYTKAELAARLRAVFTDGAASGRSRRGTIAGELSGRK
jgi:CheY-like chemotaxis protein